ncbi:MAG: hypothetical protein ACOC80_13095 [Petrotogales bacterium]
MTNNRLFNDLKTNNSSKRTDRDVLIHALYEMYRITGWGGIEDYKTTEERKQKFIELIKEIATHLEIREEGKGGKNEKHEGYD